MTGTVSSSSSTASRRTSLSSTAPPPLLTPDVEYPNPPLMAMVAGDDASPCGAPIPLPSNPHKPAFGDSNPSPSPTRRSMNMESLSLAGTIKEIQEKAASGFSPSGRLTSTPTSELGRYDYPFPEAPAPQPVTSHHSHRPQTLSSRSTTTPTTARPARPADNFFARPPRLGRRGSIASGQISRLAARLPDNVELLRERPRSTSGSSEDVIHVAAAHDHHHEHHHHQHHHEKRRCASSSSLSNLNMLTTSPTSGIVPCEMTRPPLGPSSLSTTSVSSYELITPPTPTSSTSTMSRTVYVQPASWSRAPLSFQHSPMPAPIPPSLLARRGSVPANTLLGLGPLPSAGGWSNSVYKTVYHTPAMRPRRLSGEKKGGNIRHSPRASLDTGRPRGTNPSGTSPVKVSGVPASSPSLAESSSSDRETSPSAPDLALPSPVVQYPATMSSPFVPSKQQLPPPSASSSSLPLQTIPSSSGEERDELEA